ERGRLHAAERDNAADPGSATNRRSARRVHADEPVGLGAGARGVLQRLHLRARAELLEAFADRLFRHRPDQQALDGLRCLRPRFGLMSSSFRRWKGPSSAPARSRPTEGFSAITRVLGMQNTIASLGMGAGPEILGRVKPSPFYSFAAALSWPALRWLYRLRAE